MLARLHPRSGRRCAAACCVLAGAPGSALPSTAPLVPSPDFQPATQALNGSRDAPICFNHRLKLRYAVRASKAASKAADGSQAGEKEQGERWRRQEDVEVLEEESECLNKLLAAGRSRSRLGAGLVLMLILPRCWVLARCEAT